MLRQLFAPLVPFRTDMGICNALKYKRGGGGHGTSNEPAQPQAGAQNLQSQTPQGRDQEPHRQADRDPTNNHHQQTTHETDTTKPNRDKRQNKEHDQQTTTNQRRRTDTKTDRRANRHRQTDRQTDKQTDRQTHGQTGGQTPGNRQAESSPA